MQGSETVLQDFDFCVLTGVVFNLVDHTLYEVFCGRFRCVPDICLTKAIVNRILAAMPGNRPLRFTADLYRKQGCIFKSAGNIIPAFFLAAIFMVDGKDIIEAAFIIHILQKIPYNKPDTKE